MAEERKNWIVKVIDWGFKEIWPLLLVYLFVQIVFQLVSIYLIGWPTWSEAGLNTLAQPLKISGIVNGILTLILVILGLSVAARRLLQFNQQLKQQNKQIKQQNKQINIQLESKNQQRFYDAVGRLSRDEEHSKLGALTAIRKTCTEKDSPFFEEARQILRGFLTVNTKRNSSRDLESTADSLIPISGVGNLAFNTLIDIIYTQHHQKEESEGREQMEGFAFLNLKIDRISTLKSIQFSNCNLRYSIFCEAHLDDVIFGHGQTYSNGSPAPDLSFADFTATKFKFCIFQKAEISGAQFFGSSGLKEKDLGSCFYSNEHPPRGLPDGLLLRFPYSDETDQPCTEKELDQFFANHPHFTRHTFLDNGQKVEAVKIDLSKAVNEDDPLETLRPIMGKPVNT